MDPASKPLRLFVAVPVDEAVRAAASSCVEGLKAAGGDVRWMSPETLHLTLRFLGNRLPADVPRFERALAAAAGAGTQFELVFDRLGSFGRPGRPEVVWAGVGAGAEPLSRLAAAVEDALAAEGVERELKPFRPHLTLGRVRKPGSGKALWERLSGEKLEWRLPVQRIVLYASETKASGAVHTPLRESPLR